MSGKSSQAEPNIINIILADDHPVVRTALKNEFEKEHDLRVIAEASNGEEAVKLANDLKPDVVIMDIGMPRLNGIEATRQIKSTHSDIMVLVLTVFDDIEHVLEILQSGADGYLTKTVLVEDIIHSVRSVVAGETVISPAIFQQVLKYALRYITKPLTIVTGTRLTIRELEILRLVANGMSNKEIAHKLDLGIRTVRSHLVDIFTKMKVFSRTGAVIMALRAGYLKIEDLG